MKLKILVCLGLIPFIATVLLAEVNAPRIGPARYANALRMVYGLSSNFVIGDRVIAGADASSFSDHGGLISQRGRIQLLAADGSVIAKYNSHESAPVLNIDGDLTSAIAWLPTRAEIIRWQGEFFALTKVDSAILEGSVTSIYAANKSQAKLLVSTRRGQVVQATVSLATGAVTLKPLTGIRGPVFEQRSFLLFRNGDQLDIKSPSGKLRKLPFPPVDFTVERMSSDWLHLHSIQNGQDWALHLNSSRLELSLLPAPPLRSGSGVSAK